MSARACCPTLTTLAVRKVSCSLEIMKQCIPSSGQPQVVATEQVLAAVRSRAATVGSMLSTVSPNRQPEDHRLHRETGQKRPSLVFGPVPHRLPATQDLRGTGWGVVAVGLGCVRLGLAMENCKGASRSRLPDLEARNEAVDRAPRSRPRCPAVYGPRRPPAIPDHPDA